MKLIPVNYFGFTAMDRRFSSPMLPWIVSEIRKRDYCEKLSVGIEDGILQAYNPDFELQFSHKICQVTRFSHADQDPTTFLYLMRDDGDTLLYCYLFQAKKSSDVLHTIDRVLDPMQIVSYSEATAYDFLEHHERWKLKGRKVNSFLGKVQQYDKKDLFARSGGHTFFIPVDDKIDDHRLESIDSYIIEGHVIPHQVLFTRPAAKNFVYETASNGDYIYIVVALLSQNDKVHVKSHTVLGNSDHKRGEVLVEIVRANIPVRNGVVHLISQPLAVFDKELKPFPFLPVLYKISSDPDLNITYHLGRRHLNGILTKPSRMKTFFAPKDSAWRQFVNDHDYDMSKILEKHLVVTQKQYTMSKLALLSKTSSITLDSIAGPLNVEVHETNGTYYVVWEQKWVKVVRPDYECTDGIVHVVDAVFGAPKPGKKYSFWRMLKEAVS